MNSRRVTLAFAAIALLLTLSAPLAAAAAKSEIKGAAILDHPCGKTSVKHMGLAKAGKMDEAMKLGTKEMQEQWKAMSAEERTMMEGMMKEMSPTEAEFTAQIKADGLLVVEGSTATLTVTTKHKDANGSSDSTLTQHYKIDSTGCWISD